MKYINYTIDLLFMMIKFIWHLSIKIWRFVYREKELSPYLLVVINSYYKESDMRKFKTIEEAIAYHKGCYKVYISGKHHVDAYVINLLTDNKKYIKIS